MQQGSLGDFKSPLSHLERDFDECRNCEGEDQLQYHCVGVVINLRIRVAVVIMVELNYCPFKIDLKS